MSMSEPEAMPIIRRVAVLLLAAIALCGVLAPMIAPYRWDSIFRDSIDAPPGPRFPMGTDDVGRDRLSRLLYGTSISAVLAPAAALCSIGLALAIAAVGPVYAVSALTTICLSLPWMFLFILLRAELPLNTSPIASVALTFGLMGVAGWAVPGRVFTASIREIRQSGWLLQARAAGLSGPRIALAHAWPHMRAVALAQFRILIPSYVLAEASLGLLGLGVPEPLPSWGNLLRDLQHPAVVRANPWVLAPLGLLMIVMICLETLGPSREVAS
jgi:peptide/nickel transport system permease protein